MRNVLIVFLLGFGFIPQATAQEAKVDVASIKANPDLRNTMKIPVLRPGYVKMTGWTLRRIIWTAFEVTSQTMENTMLDYSHIPMADNLLGSKFDIEVKGQGKPSAMLKKLLEQYFGFRTHTETRSVPQYVMVLAKPGKLGPKLKPASISCRELTAQAVARNQPPPKECRPEADLSGTLTERYMGPISDLIRVVQVGLELPVKDETGLSGNFVWEVKGNFQQPGINTGTIVREELESQLGLKLETRTRPLTVLVLDQLQRPKPN